jgi:CheY-like chemotaxis protein
LATGEEFAMSIAPLPAAAPRGPLTHCPHVLIVNRDPALLETARGVLERAGSNVTATNAIRSAAAMSALLGPDLLVVDLTLDPSDLATFAERLAINPHLRSTP